MSVAILFAGGKVPYTAKHLVGQRMSIQHSPTFVAGPWGPRVRRPYLGCSLAFCLFADIRGEGGVWDKLVFSHSSASDEYQIQNSVLHSKRTNTQMRRLGAKGGVAALAPVL